LIWLKRFLCPHVHSDKYNLLVLFVYILDHIWCTVLFITWIACSSRRYLDVSLFEKIQDYEEKTLSSSKWEARQVIIDHIDPTCFLSLVHILACMLQYCYLSLIPLEIWVHSWLVMLNHAVMCVVQVFHPLWYWVGLCLCESVVVLHLSRWLISSCLVVLESGKDRILGVDTIVQHVPPRVRYKMTCLLIMNTIGNVSCSIELELSPYFVTYFVICLNHMV
jgi:hypothetical protein